MVLWAWLACTGPVVGPAVEPGPGTVPIGPERVAESIRFAPDGRVLVDGTTLLDLSTGRTTGVLGGAFTPSAARHASEQLGQLHWTETGGASHLLAGEPELTAAGPRRIAEWIDEDQLYVHTIDMSAVYEAAAGGAPAEACHVIHVATGAVSTPKACLHGDFAEVWRIQIRGGLVAVDSAGEGHPGLAVYAWDPATGPSEVGFPPLDLYPFGPVDASLRADGGVDLLTPCHLGEGERPCQKPDGDDRTDEPWRHYRWKPQGAFELVREGIPAGVSADPTGDRYAWIQGPQICAGIPGSGPAACYPTP